MLDKRNPKSYDLRMQRFGKNIKKLRKKRGWNQATLGEKAGGINVETIKRIEHGQNTTTEKFYKIAAALEVPLGALLPEDERPIENNYTSVCPDNNPDHIAYHKAAERVLHSGNEMLINVMTLGLEATASQLDEFSPDGSPTKQKHGPFSPDVPIAHGGKTRIRDPKRKMGRKIPPSAATEEGNRGK